MPVYSYTAVRADGVLTRGEGTALSDAALRQELLAKGLLVQRVRPRSPRLTGRRVRAEHFLLFNQALKALVRAGLSLPEALALAADRPESPLLERALHRVIADVRGGALYSDACARHPEIFDALYLSALRAGEKTGNLLLVLEHYHEYLKRQVALRKRISQALAYPMFLLVTLAVILTILFVFVLPRFVTIYADFDAELPAATRLLIALVNNMPVVLSVIAGIALAAWLTSRRLLRDSNRRVGLHRLRQRLPLIGRAMLLFNVAYLARSLSTLLAGGTPLVEAMQTVRAALNDRAYAERVERSIALVIEGRTLADSLRDTQAMPETAIKLVQVGEASGRLDGMLAEIAAFHEELLEGSMTRLMALIEPVLMLLIGVLVGGIIVTMYLPIFHLSDVIK